MYNNNRFFEEGKSIGVGPDKNPEKKKRKREKFESPDNNNPEKKKTGTKESISERETEEEKIRYERSRRETEKVEAVLRHYLETERIQRMGKKKSKIQQNDDNKYREFIDTVKDLFSLFVPKKHHYSKMKES